MKYLSIIGTGDKPWIYLGLQVPIFLHLVSPTREKLSKKCQWPHLRSRTAACLFLTSSDIQKTSVNPCGERTTPLTDLNGDKKKYFLKLLRLRSNLQKRRNVLCSMKLLSFGFYMIEAHSTRGKWPQHSDHMHL